jgi:hypothetical protein
MPYCMDCEAWFPTSVSQCGDCGGTLTGERPASVVNAPAASAVFGNEPDDFDVSVSMPDPDAETLDLQEASRLVIAFDAVRERARGRHAAPASWLPASGTRVATAVWMAHRQAEEDGDWPSMRGAREALVDLQAFIPNEEVAAVEASARQADGPAHAPPSDVDPVRRAQAVAISMLRDDDRVLGAYNALADIDVVIGGARRSLEAVDRYKEAQMGGFAALAYWPFGLLVGLVLGTLVGGISIVAIVVVVGVAIAGYALFLAPAFGIAVGTLSSRIDRLAMRANQGVVVSIGRAFATMVGVAVFLGVPVMIGLAIAIASRWLGIP